MNNLCYYLLGVLTIIPISLFYGKRLLRLGLMQILARYKGALMEAHASETNPESIDRINLDYAATDRFLKWVQNLRS